MAEIDSKSLIVEATVYSDRALVVRECRLRLPRGESVVVFEPLPDSMDPDSLQMSGRGARLKDIAHKTLYFDEVPEEEKRRLQDESVALGDRAREISERRAQSLAEKAYVERIMTKLTNTESGKPQAQEFTPDAWIKMVDFYRSRIEVLDAQVRDRDLELRAVSQKTSLLQSRLAAAGGQGSQRRNRAEAVVETVEGDPEECVLRLSYVVYGPSWRPVYDLRASMEKRVLSISYQALVCQNSGESWDGVSLRLSTARPAMNGAIPELSEWRLTIWSPPPVMRSMNGPSKKMAAAAPAASYEMADKEMAASPMEESYEEEPQPIQYQAAEVEGSGSNVLFIVPGSGSIPSDGEPHKVGIALHELPAEFAYTAVPKLESYAYLHAKAKNTSAVPFLKGSSRIYLDNSFVAEAELGPIMPNEEFAASLGIDETVKVEYRQIRKYDASAGLGGKRKRIEYAYRTILTNTRATAEKLTLKDAFPVSGNQEIVVKEIEPDLKKWGAAMERDEIGRFSLMLELPPGKETTVDLSYTVEHPKDLRIIGL
jgi:uncharacterized protein (TIGR02231 family)